MLSHTRDIFIALLKGQKTKAQEQRDGVEYCRTLPSGHMTLVLFNSQLLGLPAQDRAYQHPVMQWRGGGGGGGGF